MRLAAPSRRGVTSARSSQQYITSRGSVASSVVSAQSDAPVTRTAPCRVSNEYTVPASACASSRNPRCSLGRSVVAASADAFASTRKQTFQTGACASSFARSSNTASHSVLARSCGPGIADGTRIEVTTR